MEGLRLKQGGACTCPGELHALRNKSRMAERLSSNAHPGTRITQLHGRSPGISAGSLAATAQPL